MIPLVVCLRRTWHEDSRLWLFQPVVGSDRFEVADLGGVLPVMAGLWPDNVDSGCHVWVGEVWWMKVSV